MTKMNITGRKAAKAIKALIIKDIERSIRYKLPEHDRENIISCFRNTPTSEYERLARNWIGNDKSQIRETTKEFVHRICPRLKNE